MKDTIVAGRYARALFLVTEKRGETPRALEDLKAVQVVLAPGSRARGFAGSPEVRLQDKRDALRKAFHGRALPIVVVFIDLLLRKTRLRDLESIVLVFETLVEQAQGLKRAHVVSAVPLLPAEIERLVTELERATAGRIRLTTAVDPRVLGGVFVRIGDRVIDRTARTLLETISQHLYEASV